MLKLPRYLVSLSFYYEALKYTIYMLFLAKPRERLLYIILGMQNIAMTAPMMRHSSI